jgi:hypothetical protein
MTTLRLYFTPKRRTTVGYTVTYLLPLGKGLDSNPHCEGSSYFDCGKIERSP